MDCNWSPDSQDSCPYCAGEACRKCVGLETCNHDSYDRHDFDTSPKILSKRCKQCNSPRKQDPCFKCGSALFTPSSKWTELALPNIELIRKLAKDKGYALGVHGSLERDLDLIAAPWTKEAAGNYELMNYIAEGLDAEIIEIERKPKGRWACTIRLKGWFKLIDLSVCSQETTIYNPLVCSINKKSWPIICPNCRNISLERNTCHLCKGVGLIESKCLENKNERNDT